MKGGGGQDISTVGIPRQMLFQLPILGTPGSTTLPPPLAPHPRICVMGSDMNRLRVPLLYLRVVGNMFH